MEAPSIGKLPATAENSGSARHCNDSDPDFQRDWMIELAGIKKKIYEQSKQPHHVLFRFTPILNLSNTEGKYSTL